MIASCRRSLNESVLNWPEPIPSFPRKRGSGGFRAFGRSPVETGPRGEGDSLVSAGYRIACWALCASVLLASSVAAVADPPATFRAPRNGGVYVIAHRGAHQGIPENTIPAYRKAIELGADFVEVDVRTTRDGRFVSVHNAGIARYVPGRQDKVAELTLAELRSLDVGAVIGPEWEGTRIPTFEEVLDLCKGRIGIYLDLKQAPVEPLVRMVEERGMLHDVVWYASDDELAQLHELAPDSLVMPDPGPGEQLPPLLERFKPKVVATVWRHHTPEMVAGCHEAGALVFADEDWGGVAADIQAGRTPKCWQEALAWGTDGIQTDRPAELIAFLKQREAAAGHAGLGSQ